MGRTAHRLGGHRALARGAAQGTVGNRTVRQIVERHGSELWSQALPEGRTCLRLRSGPPNGQPLRSGRSGLRQGRNFTISICSKSRARRLEKHRCVNSTSSYSTPETTGLRPNEGDELLSIGAVRVVNGRILTGETFERLINPGRGIPPCATRVHGITAEMVRDKPPAEVVLPQFKSFVGNSVLVAYNAAFDMKFLEQKAGQAGVKFDNPVLDALLLSVYLQPDVSDFSLVAMPIGLVSR